MAAPVAGAVAALRMEPGVQVAAPIHDTGSPARPELDEGGAVAGDAQAFHCRRRETEKARGLVCGEKVMTAAIRRCGLRPGLSLHRCSLTFRLSRTDPAGSMETLGGRPIARKGT